MTLGPQFDTFVVDVDHVGEDYTETSHRSRVEVAARSVNEATLVANQMVAARGRKPVKATIDWDNY